MNEDILSNMFGCDTYCICDSSSNRYCFIGPIECNGKLIEEFRKGIIVKLKYVERGFWIHSKKMGLIWITIPTVL